MIFIDDESYSVCMFLLREAQKRPPIIACPNNPGYRAIANRLRLAAVNAVVAEVSQLTDGEFA